MPAVAIGETLVAVDTAFSWLMAFLVPVAILVGALRSLPRLIRDMKGPIQDVGQAPADAEPVAHVVPNDDGLFTWSMRFPEDPPPDRR